MKNSIRLIFIALIVFELFGLLRLTSLTPSFSWLGMILTASVSWAALEFIHYYFHKYYRTALPLSFWSLVTAAVILDAVGDSLRLYDRFRYYDNLMHFSAGGLVIGLLTAWAVHKFNEVSGYNLRPIITSYTIVASTILIGFLYEVAEYFADWFLNTNNLADRWDTTEDMMANFFGGLLAALLFWRHQVKNREFDGVRNGRS
ncbi:MAG: hypothetical protein HY456_02620 [Parcubacteria group bacterium]|nr:hypothetical protein [Parcubacteria group bacterium]